MTEPRMIVLGSINTDLVIRSLALPRPGETVLVYQAAGGKGANQTDAAAPSRDPVLFLAAVGDDLFVVVR